MSRRKNHARRLRAEQLEARDVPALLYVGQLADYTLTNDADTSGGITNGDTVTLLAGDPDQRTGLIFGADAFSTIADALTVANGNAETDTISVARGTYAEEAALIDDGLTFDGGLGGETVLSPTLGLGTSKVVTISANDVTVSDFTIEVNRSATGYAAGVYADNSADPNNGGAPRRFNNAAVLNNVIRSLGTGSTLITPSGNTAAAGIALVSEPGPFEVVTVAGNTVASTETGTPSRFTRGVWLRSVAATVGGATKADGNVVFATAQDVLYQFATSDAAVPAAVRNNTFNGAGLDITEPNSSVPTITISDNLFAPASPLFAHSLTIKNVGSDTQVVVANNTFTGHQLGVLSGSSKNVAITNNVFTPAAGIAAATNVAVNTSLITGGDAGTLTGEIGVTIQGNTFNAATGTPTVGVDFINGNNAGSTYGTITVGGAGALANTFDAGLSTFIRLSAVPIATPPANGNNTDPAPFAANIDASGNLFGVTGGPALASAATDAQLVEIEAKVIHKPDDPALGLVALRSNTVVDTTGVSDDNAPVSQPITFTARVVVGGAAPTGTVEFRDQNGNVLASTTVFNATSNPGVYTVTAQGNAIPAGVLTVKAFYLGDGANQPANDPVGDALTVTSVATVTTLAAAPNPAVTGQPVTLTATVRASDPNSATVPVTGAVRFFVDGVEVGQATTFTDNGDGSFSAAFTVTTLTAGTKSVTATYDGNASFQTSTSAAVTLTVNPAGTGTTVTVDPTAATVGQTVTFTATVTVSAPGAATADPTGAVNFTSGGTFLGTAQLTEVSPGVYRATLTAPAPAAATYNVVATYVGDANFAGSVSAPATLTVTPAATAISVAVTPSTAATGQSLTLTATVTPSGGTVAPTGTVTFFVNGNSVGTGTLTNGTATLTLTNPGLTPGTYTVTASYAGDANFTASGPSDGVTLTVTAQVATTTTITAPSSVTAGTTIPVTVTVSGGASTPGGTVTLTVDGVTFGTATLDANGAATFTLPGRAAGTATLTASYAGTDQFAASQSAATTVTVTAAPIPSPTLIDTFVVVSGNSVTTYNSDGTAAKTATLPADLGEQPRVILADVNGDGTPDQIAGSGPGVRNIVRVTDGKSGATTTYLPFEAGFTGGVNLTAGDFNGDGAADIVITAEVGGGARVTVLDGKTGVQLADFDAFPDDPNFRGGSRAAVGDVNGDGVVDLIVGAGFGGGPRVAVFDGKTVRAGANPTRLFNDFFVFEQTLRNGVFVTAGDLTGDGAAEIIVGGGPGGGPRVFALDGLALSTSAGSQKVQRANFFAGDTANRDGVRLAAKDLDDDNLVDIVTASASGGTASVRTYLGKDIPDDGQPSTFDAVGSFSDLDGVFVG